MIFINNNSSTRILFNLLIILLIYFVWMDIALFFNIQKWYPIKLFNVNNNNNSSLKLNRHSEISVFSPLTVKLIMVDHMTHYVHDIVARNLEDLLNVTKYLPWLTANFISILGLVCACMSGRLLLSDRLEIRRLGCLLFELRNFADSLDGVIFRARTRRFNTYESIKGSLGYNVDVVCDGLGGMIFCICILLRFSRNPPSTNMSNFSSNSNRGNYFYQQLSSNNNDEDKNVSSSVIKLNDDHGVVPCGMRGNHLSSRYVKIICWAFGIRLLCTGLVWDHFVVKYHDLLEVFNLNNTSQIKYQIQAFKSIGMWLIMWFWRIGNACAILEHLVFATFFDKLWEYIQLTTFIGWIYLIILTLFTQIHYAEVADTFVQMS